VADHVAVFVAMSGLRDRFLGLRLRLNLDPGVALYVIDEAKHRLWFEGGYDLQEDFRRADVIQAAALTGKTLDRSEVRHSARVFAGYENALSENLTFDTGVEYLQALTATENFRINWDMGITSRIGGNFSVATTLNLRYDHNPLPGVKNTDFTSALSLVYQLL
jgi:putative salt-induced outer membrane protein